MRAIFLILCILLCGCGANLDAVSGSATLQNGTVTGSVSVQTPLGIFTYPGNISLAPSPTP